MSLADGCARPIDYDLLQSHIEADARRALAALAKAALNRRFVGMDPWNTLCIVRAGHRPRP